MNNFKSTLQELLLAFNRLTKIPTGLLEGMNNLKHLDLSKNRIQNIEPLSFGKYDGPSKNLIRLNLAGNQIQSIVDPGAFLYMGSLAYLDLSFNRIRQMTRSAFERLDGLESLFLQVKSIEKSSN
jgi:Leucine-rich repeat (LRR) protein